VLVELRKEFMLFHDTSFSSFSCSSCGHTFPPGYTEIPCPQCGGTTFTPFPSTESESNVGSLSFRVSVRKSYSFGHIKAAARFARMSAAIEKDHSDDYIKAVRFNDENEAYVIASILAATAFLETTINEFFADAAEDHESEVKKSHPDAASVMANMWRLEIPRTASFSILKKYQTALALANKNLFDAGTAIYQNVDLLITLRNYLIHAEPENVTWFTVGDIEPHKPASRKLAEGLKGKFPVSKLMENFGNPFFPDKCLGHGCAKWGVEASVKFTDEFFSRMSMKAPLDAFRNDFKAE
jgi:predicted  nucleic acid-binding Zn-ribbon protein